MAESADHEVIDLNGLKKLKEDIDRNIQAASKGKGKKLIIFIGPTRSGKSTTIAILQNKRIVEKTEIIIVEINGEEFDEKKIVYDVKDADSGIGHERFKAFTDTMKFFPTTSSEYILVDGAGLFDTNGTIAEIAHKTAFDYILKHSESIKPVIVLNFEELSGTGNTFKSTLKIAASIFNNDNQKFEESLMVCLTHAGKASDEDIKARLLEMFKASRSNLLGKTLGWTKSGNERFQNIRNPCSHEGDKLWEVIHSIKPLPSNEIQFKLDDHTETSFLRSMDRIKNQMIIWIENKEFNPIIETINVLSELNTHIPDLIGTYFTFAIDKITTLILNEHESAKQSFEMILKHKVCEDSSLEKLNQFFVLVQCSKNFRNLQFVNSKELNTVDGFENWLLTGLKNLESILQSYKNSNLQSINWDLIHSILNVLSFLSKLPCEAIIQIYDNNCIEISTFLQEKAKDIQNSFTDIKFLLDTDNICKLSQIVCCLEKSKVITKHVRNINIENLINEFKVKFSSLLQQSQEELTYNLQNLNSIHDLSDTKSIFQVNKLISERYELYECFGENLCKEALTIVVQLVETEITGYLENMVNSTNERASNLKFYSKINELIKLTNNPKFIKMLMPSMNASKAFIKEISHEIQNTISDITPDNISQKIKKAANLLKKLKKLMLFDDINSTNFVLKKYNNAKELITYRIDNLISSLDKYWGLKSFCKFNELMVHVKQLEDNFVFTKIEYKDKNVYESQRTKCIEDISNYCKVLEGLPDNKLDPKNVNESLILLQNYKTQLPEFTVEIRQLIQTTEDKLILKIQSVIQTKITLINQNKGIKVKTTTTTNKGKNKSYNNNSDDKAIDIIIDALNFLLDCNNCSILKERLSNNYYDQAKYSIQDTLDDIEFNFNNLLNNHEFVQAKEHYELFRKYCRLQKYFPDINSCCRNLKINLNKESTQIIKNIDSMLEKNHFRKVYKAYQQSMDQSDKQKIIEQISDYLNDCFPKKIQLCKDFQPIDTNKLDDGVVEVTNGNIEIIENEINQMKVFTQYLSMDKSIEKLLQDYENKLKSLFYDSFNNKITSIENNYKNYYISICNCMCEKLNQTISKITTVLLIPKSSDLVRKINGLKNKYESMLYNDLYDCLGKGKIEEFKKIWEASNMTPKKVFNQETDEILEKVKKIIEDFYDKKLLEFKDSSKISDLENTIHLVQRIHNFPESILTKLNTKLASLKTSNEKTKTKFLSLLKKNNFKEIADSFAKCMYSDKLLFDELVRFSQEYFDQQIEIVKRNFNENNYSNFNDDLRAICDCKEKIGKYLNLTQFDQLMHVLSSDFSNLVKRITRFAKNEEIPQLTSSFEVFIKLYSNMQSIDSVQTYKRECIKVIQGHYEGLFNTKILLLRDSAKSRIFNVKSAFSCNLDFQKSAFGEIFVLIG